MNFPDHLFRPENFHIPRFPTFAEQLAEANEPYTAKNIFNQLVRRIQRFEKSLDQEYEVGMQLVSFGQSTQFSVARLGYIDPSIIWFEGVLENGSYVELVQHVNQISFLMIALKRQHLDQARRPIGFSQGRRNQTGAPEPESASCQEAEAAATTE